MSSEGTSEGSKMARLLVPTRRASDLGVLGGTRELLFLINPPNDAIAVRTNHAENCRAEHKRKNVNVCCHLVDRGPQHLCPQSLVSEVYPKKHTSFCPGEESVLKANLSPVYLGFHYSTPSPLKETRCHVIYNNMAVILNQLKPETDYFPQGGKNILNI